MIELLARLIGSPAAENLLSYITVRALGAAGTAMVIVVLVGPGLIDRLERLGVGQVVREDGPPGHLPKTGTPTMGGLLMVGAFTLSLLLWGSFSTVYPWVVLGVMLILAAVGLLDDYLKVVRGDPRGLRPRFKVAGQVASALLLAFYLLTLAPAPAAPVNLPFIARMSLLVPSVLFIPWVVIVVVGSSNAVNLTDGLDGLASGLIAIAFLVLGVYAYLIGRVDTSAYLGLLYLPGAGELTVLSAAASGAALGFLWFNAPPALVFMGDVGSLSFGGALGAVALLLKVEFMLAVAGAIFVAEAVSVIAQVGTFKVTRKANGTGRRLLRMAPLHHHFEELGWPETRIVVRFWILGVLAAVVALAMLKVR